MNVIRRFTGYFTIGLIVLVCLTAVTADSPADAAPKAKSATAESTKRSRQNKDIVVKLYRTSWCTYCEEAKRQLTGLGVKLIEYDIEEDASRLREMKKLSGGSTLVPLVDVEGIIIRGYSPDEIDEAVEERKTAAAKK